MSERPPVAGRFTVTGSRLRSDVVLREGRIELQQDVYIIYKLVD